MPGLVLAASLVATGCAPVGAGSSVAGCHDAPIGLPILSSAGAVVVPVEIDGIAAAGITPRSSATYLIRTDGLRLPRYDDVRIGGLLGSTTGYRTRLHTFGLGSERTGGLYVIVIEEPPRPAIDGRRIMMTIGSDLLRNDEVLLDLPRRRLVLVRASACPGSPDPLAGPAIATPLREGDDGQIDVVDARLDDRPVAMEINPSSNDTIISRSSASDPGVSDAELAADPSMRMGATRGHLGWRHRFDSLRIAGYAVSGPRIAVLPDISYTVLGLDFFQNKVALFDFPARRLEFRDTAATARHSSLFSDVVTKNADTSVSRTTLRR